MPDQEPTKPPRRHNLLRPSTMRPLGELPRLKDKYGPHPPPPPEKPLPTLSRQLADPRPTTGWDSPEYKAWATRQQARHDELVGKKPEAIEAKATTKRTTRARRATAGQKAVDKLQAGSGDTFEPPPPPPRRRINLLGEQGKRKPGGKPPGGKPPGPPKPPPGRAPAFGEQGYKWDSAHESGGGGRPPLTLTDEQLARLNQVTKGKGKPEGGAPLYLEAQWKLNPERRPGQAVPQRSGTPLASQVPPRKAQPDAPPDPHPSPLAKSEWLDRVKAKPGPAKPAAPGPSVLARGQALAGRAARGAGVVGAGLTALELARRAKGAAGDQTGGEGSFDANVRSGASKATGIGREPGLMARMAEGYGMTRKRAEDMALSPFRRKGPGLGRDQTPPDPPILPKLPPKEQWELAPRTPGEDLNDQKKPKSKLRASYERVPRSLQGS